MQPCVKFGKLEPFLPPRESDLDYNELASSVDAREGLTNGHDHGSRTIVDVESTGLQVTPSMRSSIACRGEAQVDHIRSKSRRSCRKISAPMSGVLDRSGDRRDDVPDRCLQPIPPELAFISHEKWPFIAGLRSHNVRIVPTWPSKSSARRIGRRVLGKTHHYFKAGVRAVW